MKTINIGNRDEIYIAERGNTTYLLKKGDTVDPGVGNRALYTNDDLRNVTYQIDGTVKGQTGIRTYSSDEKGAVTIDVSASGRIISTQDGIDSYGDGHVIRNDGRISGLGSDAVSTTGSHTVINTGTLYGEYSGIYLSTSTDDVGLIRNSGKITGDVFAIRSNVGSEKVINSGIIDGNVLLGDGEDTFVFLRGRLDGDVDGGKGDDTYVLRRPGVLIDENVDSGRDIVKASFSLSLAANLEDLTLTGKADIAGIGNGADNTLVGNAGKNTLIGADGIDTLNGGRGSDILSGGAGADEFHFGRGTGMDVVADYAWASDKLYLNGLKGATDYADMIANHVSQKGNDLWITYGDDVIVLANSDVYDLNASYVFFS